MVYSHTIKETIKKYGIQKMPNNYIKEDVNFKVLFLACAGVGKSSLVIRDKKKNLILIINQL
jgi:GTPase SAR1 family protein